MSDEANFFVADDEKVLPPIEPKVVSNFKGEQDVFVRKVFFTGWVLAFLLPFMGVFIAIWLLKKASKQVINKVLVAVMLAVSSLLSAALLFYVFYTIWVLV